RIEADDRSAMALLVIGTNSVNGDLTQPGPEGALTLPVEPGDLPEHDDQDVLDQVGGLVAQARDAAEPAPDERPIDPLEPVPVGGVRPSDFQPIEQADGCPGSRVTVRSSPGISI